MAATRWLHAAENKSNLLTDPPPLPSPEGATASLQDKATTTPPLSSLRWAAKGHIDDVPAEEDDHILDVGTDHAATSGTTVAQTDTSTSDFYECIERVRDRSVGELSFSFKWATSLPNGDPHVWLDEVEEFHPRHIPPVKNVPMGPKPLSHDSDNQAYFDRRRRVLTANNRAKLVRMLTSRFRGRELPITVTPDHVVTRRGTLLLPEFAYHRTVPADVFAALQDFASSAEWQNRDVLRKFSAASAEVGAMQCPPLVKRTAWFNAVRRDAPNEATRTLPPLERFVHGVPQSAQVNHDLAAGNIRAQYTAVSLDATRLTEFAPRSALGYDSRRIFATTTGVARIGGHTAALAMATLAGFRLEGDDPDSRELRELRSRNLIPDRLDRHDGELKTLLATPLKPIHHASLTRRDVLERNPPVTMNSHEMLEHLGLFIDVEYRTFNRVRGSSSPLLPSVRPRQHRSTCDDAAPRSDWTLATPFGVTPPAEQVARAAAYTPKLADMAVEAAHDRFVFRELVQRVLRAMSSPIEVDRRAELLDCAVRFRRLADDSPSIACLFDEDSGSQFRFELVRSTLCPLAQEIDLDFMVSTVCTVNLNTGDVSIRHAGNEISLCMRAGAYATVREDIHRGAALMLDFIRAFHEMRPASVNAINAAYHLQRLKLAQLAAKRAESREAVFSGEATAPSLNDGKRNRIDLNFPEAPPPSLNVTAYRPPWLTPSFTALRATLSPVPKPLKQPSSWGIFTAQNAVSSVSQAVLRDWESQIIPEALSPLATRWLGAPGLGLHHQPQTWVDAASRPSLTCHVVDRRVTLESVDALHPSGAITHPQILLSNLVHRSHEIDVDYSQVTLEALGIGHRPDWIPLLEDTQSVCFDLPITEEDRSEGPAWAASLRARGMIVGHTDYDDLPEVAQCDRVTLVQVAPRPWNGRAVAGHDLGSSLTHRAILCCAVSSAAKYALWRRFRQTKVASARRVPLLFAGGCIMAGSLRCFGAHSYAGRGMPARQVTRLAFAAQGVAHGFVPRAACHDAVPCFTRSSKLRVRSKIQLADRTHVGYISSVGPVTWLPGVQETLRVGTPLFTHGLFFGFTLHQQQLWEYRREWSSEVQPLMIYAAGATASDVGGGT